jgi:thioredoxin
MAAWRYCVIALNIPMLRPRRDKSGIINAVNLTVAAQHIAHLKQRIMASFESHIKGEIPVVVDFFAEWCGPCKMMGPILHEVKEKVGERATVLKLDIDKSPYYSELYNIHAVPTVMIFKNGNVLWRKSGVASTHEILQQLNAHLS